MSRTNVGKRVGEGLLEGVGAAPELGVRPDENCFPWLP